MSLHRANSQQSLPAANGEYQEYRLKSTAAANVSHNVMILNGTNASFQDFTPPVRLLRDRKYYSDDEDEVEGMDADGVDEKRKKEPVEAGRGRRKRTRILYLEDEDEIALREQESAPWLLEDFDGQHAFLGKLEGGQKSNYVFFVNQGNEFRVLPTSRWYRFYPKLNYQALTLEEAEAQMDGSRKNEDVSRWIMKGKRSASPTDHEDREEGKRTRTSKIKSLLEQSQKAALSTSATLGSARLRAATHGFDREDIDFEDVFDDDDEGQMDFDFDQVETNNEQAAVKRPAALSSHGKQVKKLIKTLDRTNYNEDLEDDEEDPYADEEEEEEMAREEPKPAVQVSAKVLAPAPAKPGMASSNATPLSSQPSPGPSKKSKPTTSTTALAFASVTIIEADIIEHLSGPPLRTKDLIAKLKPKLKADPANKEILRELMKRMAMVKPGAASEDEKFLELKPEYRQSR